MAQASLALVGASSSGAVLRNYTLRSTSDNSAQYVGTDADSTLSAPRMIDINMTIKAPGIEGNNRVSASVKRTTLDSNLLPVTGSVTLGISIPKNPSWDVTATVDLLKQAADYLAGVAATVSGQTDTSGYPVKWAQCLIP